MRGALWECISSHHPFVWESSKEGEGSRPFYISGHTRKASLHTYISLWESQEECAPFYTLVSQWEAEVGEEEEEDYDP